MTIDNNISSLDDLDALEAAAETAEDGESETASTVGSLTEGGDDRKDPAHEPARITPEEWAAGSYYAVTITADPGEAEKAVEARAVGYSDYVETREALHEDGYYIKSEVPQTAAEYLPGCLTYEGVVNEFETADESYIEMEHFPEFCKRAKIRVHSSVVIAGDTGGGKSSLAINFLNDLNDKYPVLYFNLEMDSITILRRLVAIRTKMEIDRIANYQKNEHTARAVNAALRGITSRKPLQIIRGVYNLYGNRRPGKTIPSVEGIIRDTTRGREEPTIVIIDHALLMKAGDQRIDSNSYARFTFISEELRKIALKYNIILFVLLQQNRAGKVPEEGEKGQPQKTRRPTNSSLKESGSWENDATHIVFLWWDAEAKRKKLIMTKGRDGGDGGEFTLNYWPKIQTYTEAKNQGPAGGLDIHSLELEKSGKKSKRDQMREKLRTAYEEVVAKTGTGNVTLKDLAEVLDVTTGTVKKHLKEYGGFTINGETINPAGVDSIVEADVVCLTPAEAAEVPFQDQEEEEDIFIE